MTPEPLLTRAQVADRLGVHVITVSRWARSGVLRPCARTPGGKPRYDAGQVDAFARTRTPEYKAAEKARLDAEHKARVRGRRPSYAATLRRLRELGCHPKRS